MNGIVSGPDVPTNRIESRLLAGSRLCSCTEVSKRGCLVLHDWLAVTEIVQSKDSQGQPFNNQQATRRSEEATKQGSLAATKVRARLSLVVCLTLARPVTATG